MEAGPRTGPRAVGPAALAGPALVGATLEGGTERAGAGCRPALELELGDGGTDPGDIGRTPPATAWRTEGAPLALVAGSDEEDTPVPAAPGRGGLASPSGWLPGVRSRVIASFVCRRS